MKKRLVKFTSFFLGVLCLLSFSACNDHLRPQNRQCTVLIESGTGFKAETPVKTIHRGEDVSFQINMEKGYSISCVDYPNSTLDEQTNGYTVTLHRVYYSTVVTIQTTKETISYCDGEKEVKLAYSIGHMRANAEGFGLFQRNGFTQVGWQDETGRKIGFGHRFEKETKRLFAFWEKQSPNELFEFEKENGYISITAFEGNDTCVVPEQIEGLPVKKIKRGAFQNKTLEKLIFPPTITVVEKQAFQHTTIDELTFFDGVTELSDESFSSSIVKRVDLQAMRKPVYSGNYFDTFTDKMDRLISLKEKKKIVLFSGSSARFGYDSKAIDEAFEEYEVVNMGVFAYTNAMPQLDLIRDYMKEGDILLHAPEFDTIDTQFCTTNQIDKNLFSMTESNYVLLGLLDLTGYSHFFDAYYEYQRMRNDMQERDYDTTARDYDEDGNNTSYLCYNAYGDYIAPRPNAERDEMHRPIPADYTISSFPIEKIEALNEVYRSFTAKGIDVYFSYAPRNRSSLTEESTLEKRAELEMYLNETISVPIISKMEDYLLSGVYFYEIDNHLSDEGVALRTKQIIMDLKTTME